MALWCKQNTFPLAQGGGVDFGDLLLPLQVTTSSALLLKGPHMLKNRFFRGLSE